MKNKEPRVIHSHLFAIYPLLFLFSRNIEDVLLKEFFLSLAIFMTAAVLLFSTLAFIGKNKHKAGIIATAFWAYFFLYANTYTLINKTKIADLALTHHLLFLAVWTVPFVIFALIVAKCTWKLDKITKIINVVALCMFFFVASTAVWKFSKKISLRQTPVSDYRGSELQVPSNLPDELPDIYYIILDRHVGNNILKDYLDYDNSAFSDGLKKKGFYFVENAYSNYCKTRHSLASSLNLKYLDDLTEIFGVKSHNLKPFENLIKNNRLIAFLEKCGYTTVTFSSGYNLTKVTKVDKFLSPNRWGIVGEYSMELLNNTVLYHLFLQDLILTRSRKRILFPLENLASVTEMDSPVFAFAHIVCPHVPYIFDENGNTLEVKNRFRWTGESAYGKKERVEKYLGQLKFIDRRITDTIDEILKKSDKPPVIILQSDHGAHWLAFWKNKKKNFKPYFSILSTYYLPGYDVSQLYDTISPVNNFRLVLNHYFNMDLELLEDRSYYTGKSEYNFVEITDKLGIPQ